ncbi:MAG: protein kinase domain-containing protein [Myxococcota bacterium]
MSSLNAPAWFGRFRLTSRIATGGMAEVYVGRHITPEGKFGPMVAVKRLLPHLVNDAQVVRMFLNEARITAQIDHPNVVKIVDLGHQESEPYIAMELLEGYSFAELRLRAAHEGKRVPLGITLRILTEACRGLDAAHRAVDEEGRLLCIVHRDFTPDNVHVGVSGEVKVIDFGIAKAQHLGSNTEPGTLKGKFFYMSPEMILGKPVDHRADLFAAGVMLYEQLCGRRPFTGQSTDEVVMKIAEGRPRKPTDFDPSVPPALEEVCLKALSREPDDRFPSLQELIDAIDSVGGLAQVASREQLGEYVSELFPAEKDPQRQTLRRARQADPSVPSATSMNEAPLDSLSEPSPTAAAASWRARLQKLPVKWLVGAAVVVVASTSVLSYLGTRPSLTPEERLAAAEATKDVAARHELLEPISKDPAASARQLARAGELLLSAEAYEAALKVSEALVTRFPNEVDGHLLEARAAMNLRLGKRSEAALARAEALRPKDHRPHLLLADLRELQGDLSGALDALGQAAKKRPFDLALSKRQGLLLSRAGRLEEAVTELGAVLQKRFDPQAAAELAFVRLRQEQPDEALALLRRALKKKPQLAVGHYYLGAVLYRKGEVKASEAAYREADRLAPKDPRALLALCVVKAQTKAPDLEDTRRLLSERFSSQSAALLSQCSP